MTDREITERLQKMSSDAIIEFRVSDTTIPTINIDLEAGCITYEDSEENIERAIRKSQNRE